jgi:GT2 family glycosyltransferase
MATQLLPSVAPFSATVGTTRVSIVLVCWNNCAYLEACLASLFADPLRHPFEVVVTDNCSTDGSRAMLREKYPEVQVIYNDCNVGLGQASNQGIAATRGEYVLLLNNDTLVNAHSLDALADFLDSTPEAAAVAGKLLNPDGSFQFAFGQFPTLLEEVLVATRLGARLRPGYPNHLIAHEVRSVDWLCSACMLLRRQALNQVGVLDTEYFIYGDEVDLQYRLKRAGWQIYFYPFATTVHFGGRSLDRWGRRRLVYRGRLLFFRKQYGVWRTALLRALLLVLSLTKASVWIGAWFSAGRRERARKELRSNLDVIKLCLKLE